MGYFQHPESSIGHKFHPGYDLASEQPSASYITSVLDRLQPIEHQFQDYRAYDAKFSNMVDDLHEWHHPSIHHRPKGTLGQVFGRCCAIKMKHDHEQRHGFTYDLVVVTRWDIGYSRPIDLRSMGIDAVNMDGMYGPDVISDAWACGPSNLVDLWGQQFSCINGLIERGTMNLGPHDWLKAHFDLRSIAWENRPDVGIWIRR